MKTLPELGVCQDVKAVVVVVIPLSDTKFLKPTSRKMLCQSRCRHIFGEDVCNSLRLDDPISVMILSQRYLSSMCLDLWLRPIFCTRDVADVLSVRTVMEGSGFSETGCLSEMRKVLMPMCSCISSSSCLMKMASATPDAIAQNLASADD